MYDEESSTKPEGGWREKWQRYNGSDWLFVLVVWGAVGLVDMTTSNHHRFILSATDPAISYPYVDSQVPVWLLAFLALGVPVIFAITIYIMFRRRTKDSSDRDALTQELHLFLLGMFMSLALTMLFTDIIKKMVGRPRPNFVAYCQFENGSCAATKNAIGDAYSSFPSGHSSFAFSALGYVSLYLFMVLPRMFAQRQRVVEPYPFWLLFICFAPLALASWIAMTRIVDYWHNTDDVVCGSILGFAFTVMISKWKFHTSMWKAVPTPARRPSSECQPAEDIPASPYEQMERGERVGPSRLN